MGGRLAEVVRRVNPVSPLRKIAADRVPAGSFSARNCGFGGERV